MEFVWLYLFPMVATVPVTFILGRFWQWLKKQPSYGTVIAAPCIVVLALLTLQSAGECFTESYWAATTQHKGYPNWPSSMLRELGFTFVICALPALAVVAYFQRRGKQHATKLA